MDTSNCDSGDENDDQNLIELGKATKMMLSTLPEHSHYKKYLLNLLGKYLSTKVLASFIESDAKETSKIRYINKAKSIGSNPLITEKYPTNVKRKKEYPQHSIDQLMEFFIKECRPEKNPKGTTLASNETEKELFSKFKFTPMSSGIGYKCFIHVATELHVVQSKHGDFDLFSCPRCHNKGWGVEKMEKPKELESDAPEIWAVYRENLVLFEHQLLVKIQWSKYKLELKNLDHESLLIVQDISKHHTQDKKSVVHIFIIFRRLEGQIRWNALSLCSNLSGHEHVLLSWNALFTLGVFANYKKLYLWQDAGAPDYFNSTMIYVFSTFNSIFKLDLTLHFFEFCHGKSVADAHSGTASRKGSKLLKFLKIGVPYNWEYWSSVHDSLSNSKSFILPTNIQPFDFKAQTIKGIRQYRDFKFTGVGEVVMSAPSLEEKKVKIILEKLNTNEKKTRKKSQIHIQNTISEKKEMKKVQKRKKITQGNDFDESDEDHTEESHKKLKIMFEKKTKVDVLHGNGLWFCGEVVGGVNATRSVDFADGDHGERVKLSDIRECSHNPQRKRGSID